MEQVLADAKYLAQRLHHHDSAADALIGDASNLEIKLQAMKEVYMPYCCYYYEVQSPLSIKSNNFL